jgi:hypothetical protein
MIAVDTYVNVRLPVAEHGAQTAAARRLFERPPEPPRIACSVRETSLSHDRGTVFFA